MNAVLQQYGLTRAKLAAIVCLGGTMIGVWGNALSGKGASRSSSQAAPSQPSASPAARGAASNAAPSTHKRSDDRVALPPVNLVLVARKDPFTRPQWARPKTPNGSLAENTRGSNTREKAIAALREQGATVVMMNDKQRVAAIGDREVRPGDYLYGLWVFDINESGVILSDQPVKDVPLTDGDIGDIPDEADLRANEIQNDNRLTIERNR